MTVSMQWQHAQSHSKNFGQEEKAFFFFYFKDVNYYIKNHSHTYCYAGRTRA